MSEDTTKVYVGLDYHQDSVQVCVLEASGRVLANRSCANDWQVIVDQVPHGRSVASCGIEACCGAAALADELLERGGWSIALAHPGYVNRLKQSPDKSDFSDAKLLADLVRVGYLPEVWLAPESLRQLCDVVRYRQQLVDERRRVKQRIRAMLRNHRVTCPVPEARPWTRAWVHWLEHGAALGEQSRWVMDHHLLHIRSMTEQIKLAEQRLRQATAQDAMVAKLMAQRGIGEVTAWVMRAEIGRFDRFANGKQLARFCGLSPRNASSGQRQADAGLIKAGNKMLRATLIEAAHRLKRWEPQWSTLAERMQSRGKPGSVIAAAVGNRWMRKLYWQVIELERAE